MEQPTSHAHKPTWLMRQFNLPLGWRLFAIILVITIYAVCFEELYRLFGDAAIFFSLTAAIFSGLFLGTVGGLLGGLFIGAVNYLLLNRNHPILVQQFLSGVGLIVSIMLPVMGWLVGGLRSLQKKVDKEQAVRIRMAKRMEERIRMENLVAEISRGLINVPLDEVEVQIRCILQQIGSFTGVDRTYLHLFSPDGRTVAEQYEWWLSGEVEVVGQPMDNLHYYQWSMAKLRRLEIVQVPEVEKLPGEAAPERSLWMEMGERSVLAIPVAVHSRLAGYLGLSTRTSTKAWNDEDIRLLRTVVNLVAQLLEHRDDLLASRDLQQRLRDIFTQAGIGMVITEPSGKILETNKFLDRMLGYKPGELVGNSIQAITHPGDYPRERELIRNLPATSDEPLIFEKRILRKNGQLVWVRTTLSFVRDVQHRQTMIIGSMEDISSRKQSEANLHQRQAILEAVAAAAERFLAVGDWDKSILAAIEALGWATNVSRVVILETIPDSGGRVRAANSYSWMAPGMAHSKGMALNPDAIFAEPGFTDWEQRLRNNQTIRLEKKDFPGTPIFQYVHSLMLVPIFVDDRWWGIILLEDQMADRRWTDGEEEALRVAAGVLGMAVQHRQVQDQINRLYGAERQARQLAEALTVSAATLNASLQTGAVLDHILSHLDKFLPHDAANVMLVEDGRAKVQRAYGYSQEEMKLPGMQQKLAVHQSPWLDRAANSRRPVIVTDLKAESNGGEVEGLEWIRSFCVIPIIHADRTLGFINLQSTNPEAFQPSQLEMMEAFADQAALALQNAWLFEQSRENARQIAMLNEITRAAIGAPSLIEMLEIVVNRVCEVFHTDNAYLTFWDEKNQRPIPMASSHDPDREYQQSTIYPEEVTLTASVMECGHLLAVEDATNSPYISQRIAIHFNEKALLGLPLIVGGKKLGALILAYQDTHRFDREELAMTEQAANQIALAVAKEQLLESEKVRTNQLLRANHFISALNHIASQVESAGILNQVLDMLGGELLAMGLRCIVALRNNEPQLVVEYYSYQADLPDLISRFNPALMDNLRLIMDREPLVRKVLEDCKPLFIRNMLDLAEDGLAMCPSELAAEIFYQAGMSVATRLFLMPLMVKDEAVGVMAIWGEDVMEDDLSVLSTFASQAAAAIHNARLYEEIQRLASTDDLTGLLNHRGLFERGREEVERALRFGRPLSAIMMDIDHFKKFNDQYSHIVGNEILVMLGQRCRQSLRELDLVARYGGDEICVLLIEGDAITAVRVAERIRHAVRDKPFLCSAGETQVTLSLGVATLDPTEDSLERLIERADRALYQAKRRGRDRVVVR